MSAALLAKLTAHGVNITGQGFGGRPDITESDVAGAMAGLQKESYELLRLKYCDDVSYYRSVADGVSWRMLGRAMYGDFDISAKAATKAAMIVVDQAVRGPVCRTCQGTGTVVTKDSAKDCNPCHGTGRRQMTSNAAAKFMGVGRDTYVRKYERIVNQHVAELESYESAGISHLRRKFSEEK